MLDELVGRAKAAAGSLSNFIQNQAIPGIKAIISGLLSSQSPVPIGGQMIEIGKPYAFNENIDPYGRLSSYIKAKMSVVDLIPCEFSIDFTKVQKSAESGDNPLGGGIFRVVYDERIALFNQICLLHGLPANVYGIRLYTTDGSTASDSFNIQYNENIMQNAVNSVSDKFRQLSNIARSMGANVVAAGEKMTAKGGEAARQMAEAMRLRREIAGSIERIVVSLGDAILKGHRISFPKIWQNSTYNNNMSLQIRLISPYGHPKAVKQFIIRPLMYLIILASPYTLDGLSYGDATPITIKAYGMNYIMLGSINSITLRRGGDDTSFNVYRQPLVVDVSIDFQSLLDGFAVFRPYPNKPIEYSMRVPDYSVYQNRNLEYPQEGIVDRSNLNEINYPLLTMGKFLTSLQPIKIVDNEFQIYGEFIRPTRTDIPYTGPVGSLATGVSSPAAKNVSKLDPFSYALKSAKDSADKLGLNIKSLKNVTDTIRDKFKTNLKF